MARPGTPYEMVNAVCNRLDADGIKPSYRLVAAELDGNPSKKTILEHIDRWRDEQKTAATVPGLSDAIITAFKAEIAAHMQADKEQTDIELNELREQNQEALEALESTEERSYALEAEVKDFKDQLAARQQAHEQKEAAASSTIESLNQQVAVLQKERDQLITSGEAAKAQLQLEHAVKAVTSAEKRETELNKKIEGLAAGKTEAEKKEAVASARLEELAAKTAVLKANLEESKKENSNLDSHLSKTRLDPTSNALLIKDAEKRTAVAEQKATDLNEKATDLKQRLEESLKKMKEFEKIKVK